MPYFRVIGSFRIKKQSMMVIRGYNAVMVTITEALPLLKARKKNNSPNAPDKPEIIAKVIPLI